MAHPRASARVAAGVAPPTVRHDALEPADGGVEGQAAAVGGVGGVLVRVRVMVRVGARVKVRVRVWVRVRVGVRVYTSDATCDTIWKPPSTEPPGLEG